MIKLAVGVEDIDHLAQLQQNRIAQYKAKGLSPHPRHFTRMTPRRQSQLLDGGSIYWVIKGVVRVRQALLGFEGYTDEEGVNRCAIELDPELVPTQGRPHRAFQGWRYLDPAKAPPDADGNDHSDLPQDLVRDLEALGLL
ncbi:MAG: DUF1489 domain-containing protein [Magnetovibrio sp.]|nr:DUF1489 domain-containing protein [Magnetovibrio sp.]